MPLYSPPGQPVTYLFVDAASLIGHMSKLSERFFGGQVFNFDLTNMAAGFTRVFYYDALPVREQSETSEAYENRVAPKLRELATAASVDGVHVYTGRAHPKRKDGRQQKGVDVKIAVDMLTHTFRSNMHRAILLTGDSDFIPLVEALVREGMMTTVMYPEGSTNIGLLNAADSRQRLTIPLLKNWMTEESRARLMPEPIQGNVDPDDVHGEVLLKWNERARGELVLTKKGDEFAVTFRNGTFSHRMTSNSYDLLREYAFSNEVSMPLKLDAK